MQTQRRRRAAVVAPPMAATSDPKARRQRPKRRTSSSAMGAQLLIRPPPRRRSRQGVFLYEKHTAVIWSTFRKAVILLSGFVHFALAIGAKMVPQKCQLASTLRPKWLAGRSPQPAPAPPAVPCLHACAEKSTQVKTTGGPNVDHVIKSAYCQVRWDSKQRGEKGAAAHNFPCEKDEGGAALSRPRNLFAGGSCVRPRGRVFSLFLK